MPDFLKRLTHFLSITKFWSTCQQRNIPGTQYSFFNGWILIFDFPCMFLLLIKTVQFMTKVVFAIALITKNFRRRTEEKGQFLQWYVILKFYMGLHIKKSVGSKSNMRT